MTVGAAVRWEPKGHCPECGSDELEDDAQRGVSIDLRCVNCGAWWNALLSIPLIHRIREDEPRRPGCTITTADRARLAWLEWKPSQWDAWVLAPHALNYTAADAWADKYYPGCPRLALSTGETLVCIE